MIGCDVLEPDPPPRRWGKHQCATAEDVRRSLENHQLWYDQAIDARTRAAAEKLDLLALDEWAVKLLLRRP